MTHEDPILNYYEQQMAEVKMLPSVQAPAPNYPSEIATMGIQRLQDMYVDLEVRYFDACDERDRGAVVIGWMSCLIFVLVGAVVGLAWRLAR